MCSMTLSFYAMRLIILSPIHCSNQATFHRDCVTFELSFKELVARLSIQEHQVQVPLVFCNALDRVVDLVYRSKIRSL